MLIPFRRSEISSLLPSSVLRCHSDDQAIQSFNASDIVLHNRRRSNGCAFFSTRPRANLDLPQTVHKRRTNKSRQVRLRTVFPTPTYSRSSDWVHDRYDDDESRGGGHSRPRGRRDDRDDRIDPERERYITSATRRETTLTQVQSTTTSREVTGRQSPLGSD